MVGFLEVVALSSHLAEEEKRIEHRGQCGDKGGLAWGVGAVVPDECRKHKCDGQEYHQERQIHTHPDSIEPRGSMPRPGNQQGQSDHEVQNDHHDRHDGITGDGGMLAWPEHHCRN